jgi:hypothetical protein
MDCYCKERETNPKLSNEMKDILLGYRGICEICGKPGHMRAHPRLPTTGAWCDEHWESLTEYRVFTLGDIVGVVFIVVCATGALFALWKLFFKTL